jgi:hypothetical protein
MCLLRSWRMYDEGGVQNRVTFVRISLMLLLGCRARCRDILVGSVLLEHLRCLLELVVALLNARLLGIETSSDSAAIDCIMRSFCSPLNEESSIKWGNYRDVVLGSFVSSTFSFPSMHRPTSPDEAQPLDHSFCLCGTYFPDHGLLLAG